MFLRVEIAFYDLRKSVVLSKYTKLSIIQSVSAIHRFSFFGIAYIGLD